MEVTYEKILEHYVLKEGDTLCLHGIKYRVVFRDGTCFLDNRSYEPNDEVFQVLGIKDKIEFCEKIVKVPTYGGSFPEVRTLSDLTTVVKALYERSPYKAGDKVKLKDNIHNCPWVIPQMEENAGKVVTIKDITLTHFSTGLNGDPHQYRFKEIVCTWSPQTIDHKVEDAEATEDTRDKVCETVEMSIPEHDDDIRCGCASSSDTDMKSSADCCFMEESIIIQNPKPKIKTTIKL